MSYSKLDPFTSRRLIMAIEEHRKKLGSLPTLQDLDRAGFPKDRIELALKDEIIEEFYVTLTTGTIVKGYKVKS